MVKHYLASLKEKTGMSWADIAAASRIPEATLRKIFSGETKSPGFDTVVSIVIAMGGSINDLVSGVSPQSVIDQAEVVSKARQETHADGCRGMHGECHMISSVASAYEARIIDLKESFSERSLHFRNASDSRVEDLKKDKMILASVLGGLLAFILIMIIIDLCISNHGWIQY